MKTAAATNGHVFGPVPSRRLGRSLGVDLVPLKTCTYDCIYCQLGRTTCKTVERKEWAPLQDVLGDLEKRLHTQPDYITLSGSGEPTLFTPLDRLIDGIRTLTSAPIAVLTNGSLLHREEVQRELLGADLLIPSLDAGTEKAFQRINRPHESVSFARMLSGLAAFRRKFAGQYWLEVLLLGDDRTEDRELAELRHCVAEIRPDRVQLNTATRPPAEKRAAAATRERLAEIAATFTPPAEVIADFAAAPALETGRSDRDDIVQMLLRRPCSIDDIAGSLGMHRVEAIKNIEHLLAESLVEEICADGKSYYRATQATERTARES